jgi:hypothetical protein
VRDWDVCSVLRIFGAGVYGREDEMSLTLYDPDVRLTLEPGRKMALDHLKGPTFLSDETRQRRGNQETTGY